MTLTRQTFFVSLFLMLAFQASSQVKLNGGGSICIGDLSFFSYTPPSGKTVVSHIWAFGDGFTSNMAGPGHLFKKTGTFTVEVTATFSTGSPKTEKLSVEVVSLPTSKMKLDANSDTCQYTNNVCILDQSTEAIAGQNIVTRNMTWGDGTFFSHSSANKTECHKFPSFDNYEIQMEVVDNLGCKSSTTLKVKILPGIRAKIKDSTTFSDCVKARVCFTNGSVYTTKNKINYTWNVDQVASSKPHFANDPNCVAVTTTRTVKAELEASVEGGCSSKTSIQVPVQINQMSRSIQLGGNPICYGTGRVSLSVNSLKNEEVRWYVDGRSMSKLSSFQLNFKNHDIGLGSHEVICKVSNDNCSITLTENFYVKGPIAEVTIINQYQCETRRRVFFIDQSKGVDTANTVFNWVVYDAYGDDCIINRAKNINKGKNCNETVGWFAKHDYTKQGAYNVLFTVTDTVSGCSDVLTDRVYIDLCGQCTPRSSPFIICQNDTFLPGRTTPGDPKSYSLDNGKNWYPYPSRVPNEYLGVYDVLLAFSYSGPIWAEDYGDDSIRIINSPYTLRDTIKRTNYLNIIPLNSDSVSFEFVDGCDPYEAIVKFGEGQFTSGESIAIYWGDSTVDTMYFYTITKLKSISHTYTSTGDIGTIEVRLYNSRGCVNKYTRSFSYGFKSKIVITGRQCKGEMICIRADVLDVKRNTYWGPDAGLGTVHWVLDGDTLESDVYNHCQNLSVGWHNVKLTTETNMGCFYTTSENFVVQEVVAGVTAQSMLYYCKGLMQFQDSSQLVVKNAGDSMRYYLWDFGTGYFGTWEKNPIKSFDGSKKEIHVKHAVISSGGCRDTIEYIFNILTSKPWFTIDDTFGCAPVTVNLKNLSLGSTHFIWELGDTGNVTIEKTDLTPFAYTYNAPGVYQLNLIGIDSFYSKTNNQTYYCHTIYPGVDYPPITVTVIPSSHPGISGPDILCVGEIGVFTSMSSNDYDFDTWRMDDGRIVQYPPGHTVRKTYKQTGYYTYYIEPVFAGQLVSPRCISQIQKQVQVVDIEAEFVVSPYSVAPQYDFKNFTTPSNSSYEWDFGDDASGSSNYSSQMNPSHLYMNASGRFEVCLTAISPHGCRDSVCKPVDVAYQLKLETYNVFTPGNNDGKNDWFQIEIEGEASHDMSIFNRWGELVFSSSSKTEVEENIVWNGKVHNVGANCPSGTYFYVLRYATLIDPYAPLKAEGTITLIRK